MQHQGTTARHTCLTCGRSDVGEGRFCRWCGQFLIGREGVSVAGLGRRLLALILDTILVPLTLVIGYVVWWLIVLGRAQTPGKQIVGIWVVGEDGSAVGWGRMFLREFVIEGILFSLLSAITAGIVGLVDLLWPLWDRDNQALHDKVAGTVVVQGPRTR